MKNKLETRKTIDITPSKEAIDRLIKYQKRLINDSNNFLSKFSEDENGNVSHEVYIRRQKFGVDEQIINYLQSFLQQQQYDLDHLYEE